MHLCDLNLEDFSYELPHELIAQEPVDVRGSSRLLVLNRDGASFADQKFSQIAQYFSPGDVLVLNNTKVIPARLIAQRKSGGLVEILLIKPEPAKPGQWEAMGSPLRRLRVGEVLQLRSSDGQKNFDLTIAGFTTGPDEQRRIIVDFGNQNAVVEVLKNVGRAPLPPYIMRQRELGSGSHDREDLDRYQTVYADAPGAVAAPTAGLHFTESMIEELKALGVGVVYVTLHVGPGTFKPISGSLDQHTIEAEQYFISEETAHKINTAKEAGKRVFAVGTTSCRALETAGASGRVRAVNGESSELYIFPGFKFAIVDALITNFHLSKSSLLVLVSAFAGRELIMNAYAHAINERYRFYSYGDAMLII